MDELTVKQQRVMKMLIADVPTAEIAFLLDKTQRDIQYLIAESIKRIGARTRSGAIAILVRREEYGKRAQRA
jgi:DNA-binding CsgD family transcriptional regulator